MYLVIGLQPILSRYLCPCQGVDASPGAACGGVLLDKGRPVAKLDKGICRERMRPRN